MLQLSPLGKRSTSLLFQPHALSYAARRQLLLSRQASSATPKPSAIAQSRSLLRSQAEKPQQTKQSDLLGPKQEGSSNQDDHTPKPLDRPLGFPSPPSPGENDGTDKRNWRQRRDDFFDYEKHLKRRRTLTKKMARPYFRDWKNMSYNKGKIFVAPTHLFRADRALYFPNLRGVTLASPSEECDTTPVLKGKVSLVTMFCGTWAEQQTKTFVGDNEKLDKMMSPGSGFLQRVDVNAEGNPLKAGLVRMFMGGLRKSLPVEQHARYFLVRRGFTEEMRPDMGIFNGQVGYIYLLDSACRIRWAASAEAESGERESMIRGITKLLREMEELETKGGQRGTKSVGDALHTAVESVVSIAAE